jgi:hypothetical protein
MFVRQKVDDEIITFLNAPDRPAADKQREQEASGQNTLQGAVIAWTLRFVSSTSRSTVKLPASSRRKWFIQIGGSGRM